MSAHAQNALASEIRRARIDGRLRLDQLAALADVPRSSVDAAESGKPAGARTIRRPNRALDLPV